MKTNTLMVAAVVAAVVALAYGLGASGGITEADSLAPAGPRATAQRIAVTGKANLETNKGTFQLIPLTKGPLTKDSGPVRACSIPCSLRKSFIRNGQRITPILGGDTYVGKRGTFQLYQRLESVDVAFGYSIQTGSWELRNGTGAYAGFKGSGRFAGVGFPAFRTYTRQEGFVTKD
jgi:hypothetical protein